MKLIVENNRVIATAFDGYEGPQQWVPSPSDFVESRAFEYTYVDGVLDLPMLPYLEIETQRRLDEFARTRGYENINSATTYINSTVDKYKDEATYAIAVRDSTWQALYDIIEDATAGNRPIVKQFSEIESELPTLTWPV